MGKPKFQRKKYDTPLHPWKAERIKSERELMKKYGLKNHKEVWKTKTLLRKYRGQARDLLAKIGGTDPQIKKESEQLLISLTRLGILPAGASLDDVLALDNETILSRRLQTIIYQRGYATTIDHARQLVSHGHVAIGDRKVTIPGYLVQENEESKIGYCGKSPLLNTAHPARPKTDVYKTVITSKKEVAEIKTKESEKVIEQEKPPVAPVPTTPQQPEAITEKAPEAMIESPPTPEQKPVDVMPHHKNETKDALEPPEKKEQEKVKETKKPKVKKETKKEGSE